MGLTVGPATWHPCYTRYLVDNTPLGCPFFGGYLFCKNGLGTAFIVSPFSTQVNGATWNGTTNTLVGNTPSVSSWSSVSTALTNAGLTPSEWFVPSIAQLQSGWVCRAFWGPSPCYSASGLYWTSTEVNATNGCMMFFSNGNPFTTNKADGGRCVRAMRCVSY